VTGQFRQAAFGHLCGYLENVDAKNAASNSRRHSGYSLAAGEAGDLLCE